MQGPAHEIDINEKTHNESRWAYVFGAIVGCSGFIMFMIGISSMPQSFPEQNEPGYASTANQEQQSADLGKYQQASNQFKIGIGGIGLFSLGCIICFIVYKRSEIRATNQFIIITLDYQKRQEEQKQKELQELLKKQEKQKLEELQKKKELQDIVRKQEPQKQQIVYPGHVYHEYYLPNYRNALKTSRIHPMPLKSILKNKE
jgi:hypothetical protein